MEKEKVLNLPDVEFVHKAFGLTDERAVELGDLIIEEMTKCKTVIPILNFIWNSGMTFEERIWMTHNFGRSMENHLIMAMVRTKKMQREMSNEQQSSQSDKKTGSQGVE